MRTYRFVLLSIALMLSAVAAEGAVYTRYVQQLDDANLQVNGHDGGLPFTYSWGGVTKTFFFFGDSYVTACNPRIMGCSTAFPTNPNLYAVTTDSDASDGLPPLQYYTAPINPFKAGTPLPKLPEEGTVWPGAAFQSGADLYVFYLGVYPFEEGQVIPDTREKGIAKITNGTGPMVRTGTTWGPSEILSTIGGAVVDGGYLYVYGQAPTGWFGVFLARVSLASFLDKNAYEYWTTGGWSPTPINLVTLFDDSSKPAVQWNAHLAKWIAMSGVPHTTTYGWLSEVTIRTAAALTGPWSAPTRVIAIPQTGPDFFGSVYLSAYTNTLDRNGGRTLYFTASDGDLYQVVLYEANLDQVTSALRPLQNADDARENLVGEPLRTPVLNQDAYELNEDQESMIGLRMTGLTYYDVSPTVPTLTLSLKNPPPSAIDVAIKVEMGVPNEGPFTNDPGDVSQRARLGSQTQNVHIVPGQTTVVINAATLGPLFDLARADANWDNGRPNTVLMYLSRTDTTTRDLNFRAYTGTIPPVLDTCYGTPCP